MHRLAVIMVASFVLAFCANASIIPSVLSPTITPVAGEFAWTYDMHLSEDERLDRAATAGTTCIGPSGNVPCSPTGLTPKTGTFFTIYDFGGFDGTKAVVVPSANWHVAMQMIGITPLHANPPTGDDSNTINLSFFYNGPVVAGPADLGNFVIVSKYGNGILGSYASQATQNGGRLNGTTTYNSGYTLVPANVVPEPASMALIGAGLIGLALARKQFQRHRG